MRDRAYTPSTLALPCVGPHISPGPHHFGRWSAGSAPPSLSLNRDRKRAAAALENLEVDRIAKKYNVSPETAKKAVQRFDLLRREAAEPALKEKVK